MLAAIENDRVFEVADCIFSDGFSEKAALDHLCKIRMLKNRNVFYLQTFGVRNAAFQNFRSGFDNDDRLDSEIGLVGIDRLVSGRRARRFGLGDHDWSRRPRRSAFGSHLWWKWTEDLSVSAEY